MVHDSTSRAVARDLLDESDVAGSDELTEALTELAELGRQPAPAISPALAEAMRQAASSARQPSDAELSAADNVVALQPGTLRRRGAAVGGAVVLAMAAGMGGVAAFGPDNAVETAIESVIRWAAPVKSVEPASGDQPSSDNQPVPAPSRSGPGPEAPPVAVVPAPVPSQAVRAPEAAVPTDEASVRPHEPTSPARETPRGKPGHSGEVEGGAVPPVELPELPVPIPDPVTTPQSVAPVNPPELPLPGETSKPAPEAEPSR